MASHGCAVQSALTALDEGDLDLARELAVEARFIAQAYMKGKREIPFSQIDSKLAYAQRQAAAKLTSADDVFKLIESLQSTEGRKTVAIVPTRGVAVLPGLHARALEVLDLSALVKTGITSRLD